MANEIRHNYEYDVDIDGDTAPARVVRLVGCNKRVLEIGAGPGSITKMLQGVGYCRVTGLEIDKEAIKKLEPFCERVYQANLNDQSWPNLLSDEEPFDVIVAADVLEHVYEPWLVLEAMANIAGSKGEIVVSLPHIGHNAIISCLLDEDFAYHDWGLLDKTHIRFFGIKNMQQLFNNAGLKIIDAQFVITTPENSEFSSKWNTLSNEMKSILSNHRYGQVYQVVVKAVSDKRSEQAIDLMKIPVKSQQYTQELLQVSLLRRIARKCLSQEMRRRMLTIYNKLN